MQSKVKAGQTFVWAFKYGQEYYAHIFLALEDSGIKRDGDWKFRVKLIASTDKSEVIGSEQLVNPEFEEILILH
ncbi:hypothetical protein VF14_03295 [Nostoc linckia z18]|jgi:hypothetical protein|uniref:Uncharacterized protein n=2 Tax=Nostoc linckia TaxID=92942 RepID=A0A9Q5ZH27_NOSLI|nr:hypothetical protein [Nostoc linckia]PHK42403.1 hypothetical protein VF12_03310 [Nostoc linckia z15]PHK46911.1 hypothetical protein VF13_07935 [Nostoc linckia z16]PHJ69173.1 hypothetical protein VF02_00765 [Nostoc linckia z1]PHJ73324.1 hypothetical protein VF05_01780 [Nostoc linckia z3]PHJ78671.1 hypothetical protein VF03_00765 [Nostoc linckia z2]